MWNDDQAGKLWVSCSEHSRAVSLRSLGDPPSPQDCKFPEGRDQGCFVHCCISYALMGVWHLWNEWVISGPDRGREGQGPWRMLGAGGGILGYTGHQCCSVWSGCWRIGRSHPGTARPAGGCTMGEVGMEREKREGGSIPALSHLLAFAPAVSSTWNALPSFPHDLARICSNISLLWFNTLLPGGRSGDGEMQKGTKLMGLSSAPPSHVTPARRWAPGGQGLSLS